MQHPTSHDTRYMNILHVPSVTAIDALTRITDTPYHHDTDTKNGQCTSIIRVLLVDDHTLMREGLHQLLSLEEDIEVVGDASDSFMALQKIRQCQPEIVLLDIHMPGIDGIALTQQLTQEFPATSVLILTMYRQQQYMLQAMQYGAKGYLLKTASIRDVIQAIRIVHEGGMCIEPQLTSSIVNEYRRLSSAHGHGSVGQVEILTEKECEIVRGVAAGMSNKEIARSLSYSEKTVKNYLSVIFQKLHVHDRTQVAIFALRHGLLSEGENE